VDSFSLRAIRRLQNSVAVIARRNSIANYFQTASRGGAQPVRCHFRESVGIQGLGLKIAGLNRGLSRSLGNPLGSASHYALNRLFRQNDCYSEGSRSYLLPEAHSDYPRAYSFPNVSLANLSRNRSLQRSPIAIPGIAIDFVDTSSNQGCLASFSVVGLRRSGCKTFILRTQKRIS
jgi:hypothetical protein